MKKILIIVIIIIVLLAVSFAAWYFIKKKKETDEAAAIVNDKKIKISFRDKSGKVVGEKIVIGEPTDEDKKDAIKDASGALKNMGFRLNIGGLKL